MTSYLPLGIIYSWWNSQWVPFPSWKKVGSSMFFKLERHKIKHMKQIWRNITGIIVKPLLKAEKSVFFLMACNQGHLWIACRSTKRKEYLRWCRITQFFNGSLKLHWFLLFLFPGSCFLNTCTSLFDHLSTVDLQNNTGKKACKEKKHGV